MIRHRRPAHTMKPLARSEGLSVTTSGDETLVYDRERFIIHRLGTESATIWRLADGSRDVTQLVEASDVSRGTVETVLHQLASIELLKMDASDRRKLSRRFLLGGAGGAAVATYIPVSAASACSPHGAWGGKCRILNVPAGQNDMSQIQCVYGPDGKLVWHCIGAAWGQAWEPA